MYIDNRFVPTATKSPTKPKTTPKAVVKPGKSKQQKFTPRIDRDSDYLHNGLSFTKDGSIMDFLDLSDVEDEKTTF